MLLRNVLISLLFSLALGTASAQQYRLPPPTNCLTAPKGCNLFVPFMTEGRDGKLYLTSDNGLIHYDGQQFGSIHARTKPTQDSYDQLSVGANGRIWLLHEYGDGENDWPGSIREQTQFNFWPIPPG